MARGRSNTIISMMKWIRNSRLSIKNSLSLVEQWAAQALSKRIGRVQTSILFRTLGIALFLLMALEPLWYPAFGFTDVWECVCVCVCVCV